MECQMIYAEVPGGRELIEWFGQTPTFHDGQIVSLFLNRNGTSELKVHGWIATDGIDADGYTILDRHAVVTFSLEGIMDLHLDGFSGQNVIGGLVLRRATDRGRSTSFPLPEAEDDIEIELIPCYGLEGFIRAKKVVISFVPGKP
jgi:hypothetical protein